MKKFQKDFQLCRHDFMANKIGYYSTTTVNLNMNMQSKQQTLECMILLIFDFYRYWKRGAKTENGMPTYPLEK